MNNKKQTILSLFLFTISSLLIANNDSSFFEKIASIPNMYKISAHSLRTLLNVSFEPPIITADQLKQQLSVDEQLLVINVLPEKYHNDCHITGSINVPLPTLIKEAHSWNRSQKIVVYCALEACDAGEKGCILLNCIGFTHLADYKGGIKEWFQLNYPTQGPAQSSYLHTKGLSPDEYALYPDMLVCSRQTRWITKYQNQE